MAARLLRREPGAPARDQEAGGPRLPVPLPAGDPAGALMDRDSLRRLRAQPGYLRFVSAATLARVSDEMFSVGVVLHVREELGEHFALAGPVEEPGRNGGGHLAGNANRPARLNLRRQSNDACNGRGRALTVRP